MKDLQLIEPGFIDNQTDFRELVDILKDGFARDQVSVPMRHHHDFENPPVGTDSTLLLMPAFDPGNAAGVKLVTVCPKNGIYGLPSIQGIYLYLDPKKGGVKALIDAPELTVKRTAAASALASTYLSRPDSTRMLMIGTGALAPNLIKAHAAVRPISEVLLWGRSNEKAKALAKSLNTEAMECRAVRSIDEHLGEVDLISCATLSPTPLVKGTLLKPGQHIDLVGSYKRDMREGDDDLIRRTDVYLDTYQGGLKESGDIVIPIEQGIIKPEDIKADLFELCGGSKTGRTAAEAITCFKSVGHALEDLLAAGYYYQKKFG
jgi:ornithine cyclodeaminase